jgi:hypothetical protein
LANNPPLLQRIDLAMLDGLAAIVLGAVLPALPRIKELEQRVSG